jgi:2-iminobutanoate/2-iminopropanoate deaminase
MRKTVTAPDAPAAVGPYSHAVISNGLVYCSGQVALDAATGELVGDTVAEQTRRCMENLSAVLAAAGSGPERVLKYTVYLTDMADFVEFNEAFALYAGDDPPARATVGVAALPKGARVEVECIAEV